MEKSDCNIEKRFKNRSMKIYNPTSEGQRQRKSVTYDVAKVRPTKSLIEPMNGAPGRNHGRISSSSRQQGAKKFYRIIDFKRDKIGIEGVVKYIEYDPNRGPNIALVFYRDGEKRYILAPEGLKAGDVVMSGPSASPTVGNAMPVSDIPLSTQIHNVELTPGKGGQMVRGAGVFATLMAKEGEYGIIKLPSGEVRKVLLLCYATIGVLSNAELRHAILGKAGRNRHMGRRPHTRGVAMADPHDHPHAGSYKTAGIGMPSPKSPWGWKTKGFKTRKRQNTRKFIISEG